MRIYRIICLLLVAVGILSPEFALCQKKPVAGWVERVILLPEDLIVHAKLDTGADSSALHASEVIEFERNGENWVRFSVKNRHSEKVEFERKVERRVRIKRGGKKTSEVRRVIRAGVCLGNAYMETDITLVDRTNYKYQMLLGRLFLASSTMIDPAITYNIEPRCKAPAKKKK